MPTLWPYPPLTPVSETLEFYTDVLRTYSAEQRIALRAAPRQMFNYASILSASDMARAENLIRTDASQDWYLPIWHEGARVADLAATDTAISITTSWADYRASGYALIWESNTKAQVVTVSSLNSSTLTLSGQIGTAYTAPFVCPVRTAYVDGIFDVSPADRTHGRVSANFVVRDNLDLSNNEYGSYQSLRVITTPPLVTKSYGHQLGQRFDYVDSRLGVVSSVADRDYLDAISSVTFNDQGAEARFRRRRWLHAMRGGSTAFWLPSFREDLTVTSTITSASTSLVVAATNDADGYTGRRILILLKDGTSFYRQINSIGTITATVTLTLSSALGQTVTPAEIELVCFMGKVRLESDQVQMMHDAAGYTDTTITAIETP